MKAPRLSVIIPAYDKPVALQGCLRALTAQEYRSADFEVIVVDDGGPTELEPYARAVAGLGQLRVIRTPNGGVCAARNTGVAAAQGEWCLFTDHDCEPVAGWLAAMDEALREEPDRLIGGPTESGIPGNTYCAAHELLAEFVLKQFRERMGRPFFTGNNLAVRRELYLRVGGFNEQLHWAHEDREFADRWRQQGLELGYATGAVVRHVHDFDLRSFCRHQFNYGTTSQCHATAARASQGEHGSRFPGVGYYLRMLQYPFQRLGWKRAVVMSGLFALAQASYLCGMGWALTRKEAYKPRYRTSRPPSA